VFVLPRFDLCHVLSSSTNNFAHAQTLSRMSSLSGRMNIARVNIGFFTGFKKIKQRRISFVLGYLRILWKNSTAISIKHRILATFNIKKNSILTACMPLNKRRNKNNMVIKHRCNRYRRNNIFIVHAIITMKWWNIRMIRMLMSMDDNDEMMKYENDTYINTYGW
jgi:hypothetical protein